MKKNYLKWLYQFIQTLLLILVTITQIYPQSRTNSNAITSLGNQNNLRPKVCGNYVINREALNKALNFESSETTRSQATTYTIRVYFYICRDDNGGNVAATEAQVRSEFNELISDYAPDNICFISMGLNYIYNTTVNNNPTAALLNSYLVPGCITIFYHYNMPGVGGNAWTIPNTFCSIDRSNLGDGHTTSHEVGHCLGLLHTFEPVNGYEMINANNAATSADLIADTPADPYAYYSQGCFGWSGCSYTGNCTDPNGATNFSPPYSNIMAYWPVELASACNQPLVLTANQYTRVNSFLNTNTGLINCESVSSFTINSNTYSSGYNWITAINTITTSGNVLINGTATATLGAALVLLQPGFTASPSASGLVLIRPSACTNGSGTPKIGSETTSIVTNQVFSVFPNPANNFLSIKINSEDTKINIRIYNSTMQLVKTVNATNEAENKIAIGDLPSGLYFIIAKTPASTCNQKFVIAR